MTARGDIGAEHNTCQACGTAIPSRGGTALVNLGHGCQELVLPPPRFCTDPACVKARDDAALQRAIERGVILP